MAKRGATTGTKRAEAAAAADAVPAGSGDPVLRARAAVALDGTLLGHDAARRLMGDAGAGGRTHHAWLLHGPSGIGKCTLALRFAALLADPLTRPEDWRAFQPRRDTECARFLRLGTHPDVRLVRKELAATSVDATLRDRKQLNIPVGLIREHIIGGHASEGRALDAPAYRTSWMGGGKVFIIDEAELLDAEGQNALLKTLEEPPPSTWFVLVASHAERLLPTVRSRCQIVPMSPLAPEAMERWASQAMADVPSAERAWAVGFAEGSPGAALAAVSDGLHAWWTRLEPHVRRLSTGAFAPGAAEEMAELIGTYADAAVKRDPWASKDAANRRALAVILGMLGDAARRALRRDGMTDEERLRWTRVPAAIAEVEACVDDNVNLKLALAALVSGWQDALDARGCVA